MKKRTHERDAGESDCDGRFKARENCREHTAVCHVRKVQAREQRLSVDSNDPCSSLPIQQLLVEILAAMNAYPIPTLSKAIANTFLLKAMRNLRR
jgi:hypothetical protein